MPEVLNNPALKERRRDLRKSQTDSEKVLWNHLRNRQINGLKFFRQYSVGPYILDFYCQKIGLAVELDGSQHLEVAQKSYDRERTRFLESMHTRVIRFWSNDVLRNTNGVLEAIQDALTTNSSLPPLSKRGGVNQ